MKINAAKKIGQMPPAPLWPIMVLLWLALFVPLTVPAAAFQQVPGHVPAATATLRSTGTLPATNYLHLAIALPLRNQANLTQLLAELYDPASTNYHHFLTPAQFAERFAPTPTDYQSLLGFAKANGLTVTATSANRTLLDVTAPVGQLERAFHVTLRLYPHPREARQFFAPDTEPSLDLTVPVLHITGLDNFNVPHPMCLLKKTPGSSPRHAWTGSGTNGSYLGADFRNAYVPGSVMTGLGQKVGLLQMESGFYPLDITTYETQAGLPPVPVTPILLDGYDGSAGYANDECSLDIEMAIAMAPNLSGVLVYEGSVADDILNQMATDNSAQQLSSSYSFPVNPGIEQTFQQFAAQGQSFFNASGDGNAWVGGIASPCDDPNITIVGGTTLNTSTNGAWMSEKVWRWNDTNGSGGGISTLYPIPTWQQGLDMSKSRGSSEMRNIPDVALVADGVFVDFGNGTNGIFGGTSCASPLWAGLTALMNQQAANNGVSPVGFINPTIYNLGQSPNYSKIFHDITSGNNTNHDSDNLFFAVPGYDLCTGWGTPAGQGLIDAMVGTPNPTPPYIISEPTNQTVTVGATVTFSVLVGGLPPFEYQWSCNGTNLVGATNEFLTLVDVQTNEAGNYTVEITNAFGAANSSTAVLTVNVPLPCDPDPIGLAGWWQAEGNADDIINSNNGVVMGNLAYAPGEVGQAFVFDGSTSFITVPASPSLDIGTTGTGITLECWISPSDFDVNVYGAPLLEWDSPVIDGLQFWVSSSLYGNVIDTSGNPHTIETADGIITPNVWQHVALTYDQASGNATIYLNGNAAISKNLGSVVPQTSYPLNIGKRTGQPIGNGDTYNGMMDEISIYNRALAPNEILAIYNAGNGGKCGPNPTPPIFVTEPTNETVAVGGNVSFSAGVSGSFPITYQWMFDETNIISGATNSVLALTNVQLPEAGIYSVIASNPLGSATSSNATLTVIALPPVIATQPTNQTVILGSTATFSVVAGGSFPLTYQWLFQGTNLIGATNATLRLPSAQLSEAGNYNVLVTNEFGSVLSSNVTLTVTGNPPTIVIQPSNSSAHQGNPVALQISASGTGPLYYQWLFQGSVLNGATNSTLFFSSVQIAQAGTYNVVVYNVFGTTVSSNAVLTVLAPPVITGQPTNQTAVVGSTVTLSVTATGTSPLFYHWFFNGTNSLVNSTNATLILSNAQPAQAGTYFVQITNAYGQAVSSNATLGFYTPPRITTQPTNLNLRIGSTAMFSVTATGSATLMYQWYWNATNSLPGATNNTLILTNAQITNAGTYGVVVTNIAGSAVSSNALLLVNLGYHFVWSTVPSPRIVNVPFAVSLQAQTLSNTLVTNFTAPVYLTTTNGVPVHPSISGSFVRGSWTGSLSLGQMATNVVLQANDGFGDIGLANPIDILAPPVLNQYAAGDSLLLFWPTNIPGFILVTSPRLNSTNWVQVPGSFQFGHTNIDIIDTTGSNAFFRLLYNNP